MRIWLVLMFLAATLLSGCKTTRYQFTPPPSDQGRLCVAQCASIKETCRGHEIRRAQSEKNACERTEDQVFRACISKPSSDEKACKKQRKYCSSSEHTWRCDEDYRSCYQNCGGTILQYEE
jgi:hypothetical protein